MAKSRSIRPVVPGRRPAEGPEPRARAVAPMGAAVQAFLAASGLGSRIRDQRVFDAWNRAVGTELAARARPARLRGGELLVEVDSAAHKSELEGFTGEQYLREANRLCGQRITRVVFKLAR